MSRDKLYTLRRRRVKPDRDVEHRQDKHWRSDINGKGASKRQLYQHVHIQNEVRLICYYQRYLSIRLIHKQIIVYV